MQLFSFFATDFENIGLGDVVQWYNPFHDDSGSRNSCSKLVHELQFSIPLALPVQLFMVLSCDLDH